MNAPGETMSIILPNFQSSYFRAITACGEVVGDKPLPKSLRDGLIARYLTPRGPAFVRLMLGKRSKHLHVDCVLAEVFSRGNPKPTCSKKDILLSLKDAVGLQVDISVTGQLLIPAAIVPEKSLVKALSVTQKLGEATITLTDGTLAFSGMSIKRVQWSYQSKAQQLKVTIEADKKLTVTENYLKDVLNWMSSELAPVVIGRTGNE